MKHIKAYESLTQDEPEIGDYVYCMAPESDYNPNNFVGKLTKIVNLKKQYPYRVKYPLDDRPDEVDPDEDDPDRPDRLVRRDEIIHWSKNKEDMEAYDSANKFNL